MYLIKHHNSSDFDLVNDAKTLITSSPDTYPNILEDEPSYSFDHLWSLKGDSLYDNHELAGTVICKIDPLNPPSLDALKQGYPEHFI